MSGSSPAGVIRRHAERLMALPEVVGVAEGQRDGGPCVLVLVRRLSAEVARRVPSTIEGVPTSVLETGEPGAR